MELIDDWLGDTIDMMPGEVHIRYSGNRRGRGNGGRVAEV